MYYTSMIDRYTFQYFTCLYLQSNAILHPQLDANLWFEGPSWGSRAPFGGVPRTPRVSDRFHAKNSGKIGDFRQFLEVKKSEVPKFKA